MQLKKFLVGIGLAAVAAAALATVTFNLSTGKGFVGKGDVQIAFGWNNAQVQRNAGGVTFTYNARDTYDVTCSWSTETGHGTTIYHDVTVPKHTGVNASVAYNARVHNQIDGFNLTGLGATIYDGVVPVVGGTCPGGSELALISAVTLTSSTGGLYVNYGGVGHLLTITPTL